MNLQKMLMREALAGESGHNREYVGVVAADIDTLSKRATTTEYEGLLTRMEAALEEERIRLSRKIIGAAKSRDQSALDDLLHADSRLEGQLSAVIAARQLPTILQKKAKVRLRELDKGDS